MEADLPGVKRDDVSVNLQNNELRTPGEVKERERRGALRRHTRRTRQFDRVLQPGEVGTANVEAGVHEEVLRIQVHKTEQAKPRRIAITAG